MGLACCKQRPGQTMPYLKTKRIKNIGSSLIVQPLPLVLKDLQIKKQLKRGTFGRSYKVQKRNSDQIYAMKIISKQSILDTGLTIEKNYKMTVFTPFCVHLQCAFEQGDFLYSVVDYIDGSQVYDELRKVGKFTEDIVAFYAAEVILALEDLHQQNIVYRNLNPERILIDKEGHIKLCDFGVYSIFKWTQDRRIATLSEATDYKSPEQVKQEPIGPQSDLWQLGICLYEMLFGKSPFIDKEKKVVQHRILNEGVPFDDSISFEAIDLIQRLLKQNPDQRIGAGRKKLKELKAHKFFHSINWEDVEQKLVTPPIQPNFAQYEA